MSDLTYIQSTQEVKIAGQNSSGSNSNYVGADANGNMFVRVSQTGNLDSGNSSTTPLGSSATFTGTGLDVSGYASIHIFAFADQAGTLNIQFSTDNSHWDDTIPFNVVASDGQHIHIGPQAQYFRIQYVNGGSAQGTFRLQVFEQTLAAAPPVVSLSSVPDTNGDAIVTQSAIIGKTTAGGGGYVPVKVNPSGTLTVDASGTTITTQQSPSAARLTDAAINVSSSGDNTLIAGVGGQTIRVFKIFLVLGGAANITFKNDNTSSFTGAIPMLANGAFVLDFDSEPWFTTSAGNAFVLNLSTGVQVSGAIYYTQA